MNTYQYLIKKLKEKRQPHFKHELNDNAAIPPTPQNVSIATIAIVLDGEVQEVIRAQDRLAALFLSSPEFVEVEEGLEVKPTIGWKYADGVFYENAPNIQE